MKARRILAAILLLGFVVTLATEACTGVAQANVVAVGEDETLLDLPFIETPAPLFEVRLVASVATLESMVRLVAPPRLPVFMRTMSLLL